MKANFVVLAAAAALLAGCGDGGSDKPAASTNTAAAASSGNPATAPADYLGALSQSQKFAQKKIDVSYLNQAVQLFNAQEGRNPKTLQELVPNYVAKLPDAPYGYKLAYDPATATVTVVKQ